MAEQIIANERVAGATTAHAAKKTCSKCGEVKLLELFPKRRRRCKACTSAYKKAWKKANPEKVKAHRKSYEAANREKINDRQKKNVSSVSRSYAAVLCGISAKQMTPQLHELVREGLLKWRALNEMKAAIKGLSTERQNLSTAATTKTVKTN